ncbi:MAG: PEP-utilizing enzyme [bacterium]|nr:PEP-utilizing enzyme [bacterium]
MRVFEKLKKQYLKTRWYQQGAAALPYTISHPWKICFAFTLNFKPIRVHYRGLVGYWRSGFVHVFFPYQTLERIADFYTQKAIFVGTNKRYKNWLQKAKKFREVIKSTEVKDFSKLTNQQLINIFFKFSKQYAIPLAECIFHDAFDALGAAIFAKILKQNKILLTDNQIRVLLTANQLSWLQQERLDLARLAVESKTISKSALYKKLEIHAKNYHWIYNDYAVVRNLAPLDFLKRLQELRKNQILLNQALQEFSSAFKGRKQKLTLIRKLKISTGVVKFAEFLSVIALWRDQRKTYNQMANALLNKFNKEFARRKNIPVKHIEYLYWWELKDVFSLPKSTIHDLYKKRSGGVFLYGNPSKNEELYGKRAKELFRLIVASMVADKDVKGQATYPGVVQGRIKIVRTQQEFKKMKKGDILLAPNTRPEYVPIMKLAAAILSEEGGITTHSAIVSRELRIPCIVGVQGAIARFKDGDIVEVDANKGIVRKLK